MKRLLAVSVAAIILLAGCSAKEEDNISFAAIIDEIHDNGIFVTTIDYSGFDRANVGYGDALELEFDPAAGQKIAVTILPEMRESYPVQVTAVAIELLEENRNAMPDYRKITPEEAKEMIDGGGVVILDVRTEAEFAEAHIAGAVLIPDYEIEALAPEIFPDKDKTILVYCRSGRRSEIAARALAGMGYANIYDLGGIIDWPYETAGGESAAE